MKVFILFISALLVQVPYIFAQPNYQWSNSIITTTSSVTGVGTDASGNIYTTGFFSGTHDFDYGPVTQSLSMTNGIYISKRTSSGDLLWVKGIDPTSLVGYPNALGVDQSGNVVIAGYFSGDTDFDPGVGTALLTPAGDDDIFVLKLDANGDFLWVKQYGGIGEDRPEKLAIDNSGNVYINGYFNDVVNFGTATYTTAGADDICLLKIDPNGNTQWAQKIGGLGPDKGTSISVDGNGDVYATGFFQFTCDFNPGAGTFNLVSAGSNDIFVLKLNTSGVFQWAKKFSGTSNNRGMGINVDPSGNVYASGFFNQTCDFDPSAATLNFVSVGTSPDGYIVKLDNSGNLIWAKQFDGEENNSIIVQQVKTDAAGNVYASIEFSATLDFDPNAGVQNVTSLYCCDVSILKLDQNGDFQWVLPFLGNSANIKRINDFQINLSGSDLCLGGSFNTSIDVDPGPGSVNLTSPSAANAYFVKLGSCVAGAPVPTSATLPDLTGSCSVNAPNAPTATNCNGTFTGVSNVTFPVTNQGTTIVTWTFDDGNGNTSTQTQTVIVDDVTAPIVPTLTTVTNDCSATVNAPTTTDNCAGTITGTTSDPLTYSSQGTYTIHWTFDDGNGNTSTQTQTVIVDDVTSPIVPTLATVTNECSATVNAPTTTDNCAGTITGTTSDPLTYSNQGTYTIHWTFDDGNGNTSTQTQTVVIDDLTAPVPNTPILTISTNCPISSLAPLTATDNCAGTITGTTNTIFPITALGSTNVVWSFDDGHGNISTQIQPVTITAIDVSTTLESVGSQLQISSNTFGMNYQWLKDCGTLNTPILNETNQNYIPTSNGSYAVIVSNGTCADTSACVVIADLGVNEINEELLVLAPNPSTDFVTLTWKGEPLEYRVFDMQGKVLSKGIVNNGEQISITQFSNGVYYFEFNFPTGAVQRKIIKE